VVKDDRIHLFYQTYGNGARDAICHAVSEDGVRFVRDVSNPVFRPQGSWTCGRAIDAEVFAAGDQWVMLCATRDPSMQTQMLVAAGCRMGGDFDRESWRQLGDGPVLAPELPWERRCIEAPSVIRRGTNYLLFYAGGYNNEPQQIGVASGRDGLQWTRLSREPLLPNGGPGDWNASESGHPAAFADTSGRTFLFFQGNADGGKTWRIACLELGWQGDRPVVIRDVDRFPGRIPPEPGGAGSMEPGGAHSDPAEACYPDLLLGFLRQQRCAYNPWLDAECHPHDGRTAYGPLAPGTFLDARGGWHDAADLLKLSE
jgi:hypothetical protein